MSQDRRADQPEALASFAPPAPQAQTQGGGEKRAVDRREQASRVEAQALAIEMEQLQDHGGKESSVERVASVERARGPEVLGSADGGRDQRAHKQRARKLTLYMATKMYRRAQKNSAVRECGVGNMPSASRERVPMKRPR